MEQDVLLKDVLPYIEVWTGIAIVVLLISAYKLWNFSRKHPEIFQADKTSDTPAQRSEKAELRRQYNNKLVLYLSFIFVWVIGMVAICFGFNSFQLTFQEWSLLTLSVLIIIWILSMLKRKP